LPRYRCVPHGASVQSLCASAHANAPFECRSRWGPTWACTTARARCCGTWRQACSAGAAACACPPAATAPPPSACCPATAGTTATMTSPAAQRAAGCPWRSPRASSWSAPAWLSCTRQAGPARCAGRAAVRRAEPLTSCPVAWPMRAEMHRDVRECGYLCSGGHGGHAPAAAACLLPSHYDTRLQCWYDMCHPCAASQLLTMPWWRRWATGSRRWTCWRPHTCAAGAARRTRPLHACRTARPALRALARTRLPQNWV